MGERKRGKKRGERRTFALILVTLIAEDVALLVEAGKLVANLVEGLVEGGKGWRALGACACWL